MPRHATPLKFLFPGSFAVPTGPAGMALAWHRAVPARGEAARALGPRSGPEPSLQKG
jgi:tellurite resistance protein